MSALLRIMDDTFRSVFNYIAGSNKPDIHFTLEDEINEVVRLSEQHDEDTKKFDFIIVKINSKRAN